MLDLLSIEIEINEKQQQNPWIGFWNEIHSKSEVTSDFSEMDFQSQSVCNGLAVLKLAVVFMGFSEPSFIGAASSDFAEACP